MLNNNVVKTDDKTQFMIVEAQHYKGGASQIDIYYGKRHCDVWGWGEIGVVTFLNANIDKFKSYTKTKPVNIAQVLILNLYMILFFNIH